MTRAAARAVAAGERRALSDALGRVGRYRIRLVLLDSARPDRGPWDPGLLSANASRAARDPTAVAYLGELGYGASAVSVPITNDAGLLQVSPGEGLTSLTRTPPGEVGRGGSARYYPSGSRSFLRLVPNDLSQADALLDAAAALGRGSIAVVTDAGNSGEELGREAVTLARRRGDPVVALDDLSHDPRAVSRLARDLAERRPGTIVYTGILARGTSRLLRAIAARLPKVPVLGTSGLSPDAFGAPATGRSRVFVLSPFRPLSSYPPSGRRILRRLPARVRRPEALYGYESMLVVLDAIRSLESRGEKATRAGTVREALAPRTRRAPIGSYRVEPSGDVSEADFAEYRVKAGRLLFERLLR